MNPPKFRVAICGGGISGLCLAIALSKSPNIQVDVYEAAQRFSEIGAGVMIWAKTWRILELLGLADQFSKVAHAPPDGSLGVGFDYRRSDQPEEGFQFHLVEVPYGCIRFHRAHFLDVFVDHLPPGIAHFGKRLSSYSDSSPPDSPPVSLQFSDNSTAACDVLIGCDGIKSLVRAQMFRGVAEKCEDEDARGDVEGYVEPVWSGTIAYRGLVPAERLGKEHRALTRPMMYCGKGKHVVSYSISQGSIVNVVTFAIEPEKEGNSYEGPWVVDCTQKELLDCYAGWEPEVEEMLKCIDKPTRWGIHQLNPLPFYTEGRVALLGDAAHAMTPHQGAGAGQAIEDAHILSSLLTHPMTTLHSLPVALKAYEHARLLKANSVVQGSRDAGLMYEFNSAAYGDDYERLGKAIQGQWDWVW